MSMHSILYGCIVNVCIAAFDLSSLVNPHRHHYRRSISNIDCAVFKCNKKAILCALRTSQSHDNSHCHNSTEAYRYYYNQRLC